MMMLEDRLRATDGRPAGFDYLRIGLALAVLLNHDFRMPYQNDAFHAFDNSAWRPVCACIVPMFFALSGFLVAGSLQRSRTLVNFLGLRALRIFPALIVEVVLSALLLGPLLTSLPWHSYFSSAEFHRYFLNCLGLIHYQLPGVFTDNPHDSSVNAQLWTVPFELQCYLALAGLTLFTIVRRRWVMLVTVAGLQLAWGLHYAMLNHWHGPAFYGNNLPGRVLVFSFLFGVLLYNFRGRVLWNGWVALGCAALSWVLLTIPAGCNVAAAPLAYVTAYLGLTAPRRLRLIETGDYSYGIYLFSWPIQQMILALGAWTHHWYVLLPLSLPPSVLFAVASWHLVEKHAARLKPGLKSIENRYLSGRGALGASVRGMTPTVRRAMAGGSD